MIRLLIVVAILGLAIYGGLQLFDVDATVFEDGSVSVSACAPWRDCADG
jgi:hypothetical protein